MTDKRDLISRREFASRSVLAAAAVAAGKTALHASPAEATRVLGANDRVVLAILRGDRAGAAGAMRLHIMKVCEEYEAYAETV